MAIVKMKKLKLFVASPQREKLLRELMLLGCVEVSEPSVEEGQTLNLRKNDATDLVQLRTDLAAFTNSIALLKKYAPEKSGLLSPLPEVPLSELLDETKLSEDLALANRIIGLDDKIRRLTAEETAKRAEIQALTPWKDLDLPLECNGTETSALILATFPGSVDLDQAESALESAVERAELFRVCTEKSAQYVALVCYREDLEAAQSALRSFGFAAVNLGDFQGTAAENIRADEAALVELAAEKERCAAEIAAQAEHRMELKLRADTVATKVSRAEAEDKLLCTDSVSILEGWVPAEKESELENLLESYDCAWETREPVEEEYPQVPVKLKNGKISRALNTVTEMYSLPAYDGVDPNPLMTPFFILFYGAMMADMGYGLLMIIICSLVLHKKKPRESQRNFFELFRWCGISTFFWGFLTGGFFGDAPAQVAKILGIEWGGLWSLFNPLEDTVMILAGAMCMGLVHILTGTVVGFIENVKAKNWGAAISDQVCVWFLLAGIACAILGAGPWVLIIGLVLMVVGSFMTNTGFGKITGIFGAIYNNATGYFGDILSYARIMALMLAGSVIAQVFNTIGAIPGNLFVFLIISILGNALNFGLNLLGCYVHDLRLQCLEFFGKFYKDGGKPFRPLDVETKFVNVAEQ